MIRKLLGGVALAALATSLPVSAAVINVLWYTGGVQDTSGPSYNQNVLNLAAAAPGAPGGNTWNVTFWASGAIPAGSFNVLVVASPQGGWSVNPNYASLDASGLAGTFDPTAQRLMVTGQDADWHYMNSPGPTNFNGPKGFLLDAINWAGSGTGMGLLALGDVGQARLLINAAGDAAFAETGGSTEDVRIPAAEASFPINTNLTSAGLSNWGTSAHDTFSISNATIWDGINTNGASTTSFVTIVSAAEAGGGISGVPSPRQWCSSGRSDSASRSSSAAVRSPLSN